MNTDTGPTGNNNSNNNNNKNNNNDDTIVRTGTISRQTSTTHSAADASSTTTRSYPRSEQQQQRTTTPTTTTATTTTSTPQILLFPESFQPSSRDVIVGRGRDVYWHTGNLFFRQLVISQLQNYAKAQTKVEKSRIIESVMDQIRSGQQPPDNTTSATYNERGGGGFVKKCLETNRWYEIGDDQAKEKISQTFRDFLHEHYASSNETRKKVRRGKGIKNNRKKAGNKSYTALTTTPTTLTAAEILPTKFSPSSLEKVEFGAGGGESEKNSSSPSSPSDSPVWMMSILSSFNKGYSKTNNFTSSSLGCTLPPPSSSINNNETQTEGHLLLEPIGDFDMNTMMEESLFANTNNDISIDRNINNNNNNNNNNMNNNMNNIDWQQQKKAAATTPTHNYGETMKGLSTVSQCLQLMHALPNNRHFPSPLEQQMPAARLMMTSVLGSSLGSQPPTKTTLLPPPATTTTTTTTTVPSIDGVSTRFLAEELDADEKALLKQFAFT